MARIESVHAATVTDPAALGRPGRSGRADWHDAIDHMNPFAGDLAQHGPGSRFEPPWAEAICVVTAADGTFGVGLTAHSAITVPLVRGYLGPMIIGEDPLRPAAIWSMMARACAAHFGVSGLASHAISAVDLAIWDLRGKLLGQPVHALVRAEDGAEIGGDDRQPLRCYATALDATAAAELGFEGFKLPCPWGPDIARSADRVGQLVAQARAEVGPDAPLMLDGWSVQSVDGALAVIDATADADLAWFEDYLEPDDRPGYRTVRAARPTARLASGERWYTPRPFLDAIEQGWVDIVQPDALWVGGATPTIAIARAAAEAGVGFALHCGGNDSFGQHLAFGIAENEWAEFYLGAGADAPLMDSYRATAGMALPVNGRLRPSDAPGFGIELTSRDLETATR